MRLLVECTFVYNHPHVNSGIQRVVRNITRELVQRQSKLPCIPIVYKGGATFELIDTQPTRFQLLLARIWQFFQTPRHRYWLRHANIEQYEPFKSARNWRRALYVVARIFDLIFLLPLGFVKLLHHWLVDSTQLRKIDVERDDILLLLDSSWHSTNFRLTEKLKQKGIRIVAVIYDIIPITHPHFFDSTLATTYQRWFQWIAGVADGFVTISKTVGEEARTAMANSCDVRKTLPWFDHFYLGSELDLIDESHTPSSEIISTFAQNNAVYLAVSTIEPRKNQSYLVDAFDLLWQQDVPVILCIVGRVGWKCENLIRRVRNHPEFGRQLFMYNDASDTDLNYCYTHAKALLCPSISEGFGLPIVEAMQRSLPVMASDISIFREVGSDFIAYFNLEIPSSLAQLVATFEETGKFPAPRNINEWQWINWGEAAEMLTSKVLAHVEPKRAENDSSDSSVTRANYS